MTARDDAAPQAPTAEDLHQAADLLLAQYLLVHPSALPSNIGIMDVMRWNKARIEREKAAEVKP